MTWRESFRPQIAAIIALNEGKPEREIRKALRGASQFRHKSDRRYWPYKVWLDEIRLQLGRRPPLGTRKAVIAQERNPNQLELGAP